MTYWLLCCNFFLSIFRFCFNFVKEACGCMHGHPLWLSVKNFSGNAGDMGLMPGSGRSPGEGNRNPLQYSCLGNPMDRGAWRATVHGVTKSWACLSDWARAHRTTWSTVTWIYGCVETTDMREPFYRLGQL